MMSVAEKNPLVLVVNNDTDARLAAEAALKGAGYAIVTMADDEEVVAACDRCRPDLIVLDAVMSETNGFSTVCEIRKRSFSEWTPILMLTSLDDPGALRRAYEAGVTDFVPKPVNWTIFGHRIGYVLRLTRAFHDFARSEEELRTLVRAIPDKILRISRAGVVLDVVSESGKQGNSGKRSARRKLKDMIPGAAAEQALLCAEAVRSTGETQRFEFAMNLSGEPKRYEARLAALPGGESLFISRDITDQKMAEERLAHMAYHDVLTGLPNRVMLSENLEREIAGAKRRKEFVGVIVFDLNQFKEVNDTMGHEAGDHLLILAAERLKEVLRETDIVARFGGDEFCAILPGQTERSGAMEACRRIDESFSAPFDVSGRKVSISISSGVSTYPFDGEAPEVLIKKADIAMYRAKSEGTGYLSFTEEMSHVVTKRIRIENELREALERKELQVYYQPEVDLQSGKIVGAEALMRWRSPSGDLVTASEFIPLAEEIGVIAPMSEYVFRTVCSQMKKWSSSGFSPFHVSVNVSSRLFRKYDLSDTLLSIIKEAGVAPESLELEITESSAIQNLEQVLKTVWKLNGLSIRVAMDDFGTSYSSLMCFRKFPINLLKIDKMFISELERSPEDQTIVKAIIAMANTLGVNVLAKGVEREEQAGMLKDFGCRLAQGYYFGRPAPAEEFTGLLERGNIVC